MTIEMTPQEWQQVLAILAMAPWRDANPLMMKIGAQMQAASPERAPSGNSREVSHVE